MTRRALLPLLVAFLLMTTACGPTTYIRSGDAHDVLKLQPGEAQIERGEPLWLLDMAGSWIFGLPTKIALANAKMNNHDISDRTEARLRHFLADNELNHVKVRINQYAPLSDWGRLFDNEQVHWGWRYTLGTITMIFETILPGRVFGGDNYNPFTNTINLYSDHSAVALHEAGHAKDYAQTEYEGLYAFSRMIPFLAIPQEWIATEHAIQYHQHYGMVRDEAKDYKILYPALGSYVGGGFTDIGGGSLFSGGFILMGHLMGRMSANEIE